MRILRCTLCRSLVQAENLTWGRYKLALSISTNRRWVETCFGAEKGEHKSQRAYIITISVAAKSIRILLRRVVHSMCHARFPGNLTRVTMFFKEEYNLENWCYLQKQTLKPCHDVGSFWLWYTGFNIGGGGFTAINHTNLTSKKCKTIFPSGNRDF